MYNQTYDHQKQIRLAAPTMSGKIKWILIEYKIVIRIILEYLQGQTSELHIDIRRIDINDIPSETNEQISNWLYQRFDFKDK